MMDLEPSARERAFRDEARSWLEAHLPTTPLGSGDTAEGFARAMDISCHSFIRMCRLAEPLVSEGGTLFTMSYHGAEKVIENYNIMGPVKAALESTTRYLASELGRKGIRVHAISPGPLKTRAASGIDHFDELMARVAERAPAHTLVSVEDVGMTTAVLATGAGRMLTGSTTYVDAAS